jgi:hypothetical protein
LNIYIFFDNMLASDRPGSRLDAPYYPTETGPTFMPLPTTEIAWRALPTGGRCCFLPKLLESAGPRAEERISGAIPFSNDSLLTWNG